MCVCARMYTQTDSGTDKHSRHRQTQTDTDRHTHTCHICRHVENNRDGIPGTIKIIHIPGIIGNDIVNLDYSATEVAIEWQRRCKLRQAGNGHVGKRCFFAHIRHELVRVDACRTANGWVDASRSRSY